MTDRRLWRISFAERLRVMRVSQGISVKKLSAMSGVSTSAIRNYEAAVNEPSIYSLARLADALGVTADALIGGLWE